MARKFGADECALSLTQASKRRVENFHQVAREARPTEREDDRRNQE